MLLVFSGCYLSQSSSIVSCLLSFSKSSCSCRRMKKPSVIMGEIKQAHVPRVSVTPLPPTLQSPSFSRSASHNTFSDLFPYCLFTRVACWLFWQRLLGLAPAGWRSCSSTQTISYRCLEKGSKINTLETRKARMEDANKAMWARCTASME